MTRAAVALVALVVLAWLLVMERDVRLQARGTTALQAGDLRRAEADLRAARLLNPDTAPDVTRALAIRAHGDVDRSLALVESVVRREPENARAWRLIALLTEGADPRTAHRARLALQRLDPVNVPPRPSR